MAEVFFKVNDRLTVKAEGENIAELFSSLSELQQVFSENKCGVCGGDFTFAVRKVDAGKGKFFTYYECRCTNTKCRAKLSFGQTEGGVLYPKRKWDQLSDGEKEQRKDEKEHADKSWGYLPNHGWNKYKPEKKDEQTSN